MFLSYAPIRKLAGGCDWIWTLDESEGEFTLTGGNSEALRTAGGPISIYSNIQTSLSITRGRWYWEFVLDGHEFLGAYVGLANHSLTNEGISLVGTKDGICFIPQLGTTTRDSAVVFEGEECRDSLEGAVIGFAFDADNGQGWIRINNSGWIGGGNPTGNTLPTFENLGAVPLAPTATLLHDDESSVSINAQPLDLAFTPPTNFKALSINCEGTVSTIGIGEIDTNIQKHDPIYKVESDELISLSGKQETTFHRFEDQFVIMSTPSEESTWRLWREFGASVAAGETFTIDPFGTKDTPDDPIQVKMIRNTFKEVRLNNRFKNFSFKVKAV